MINIKEEINKHWYFRVLKVFYVFTLSVSMIIYLFNFYEYPLEWTLGFVSALLFIEFLKRSFYYIAFGKLTDNK